MAKFKDRGCKAFPYRLTCRDSVTWHEVKDSARRYAEREGLKGCARGHREGETVRAVV